MSDSPHDHAADEAHTGPIKNPKQLLISVFFSFVVPIFLIIGLVFFVVSAYKPGGMGDGSSVGLGGLSEQERVAAANVRLQKVGMVEIRDANRELKSGEEVFKAQCTTCHAAGVAGAPKLGDAAAWTTRISTGYEALLHSALKGKGAMAAQGGGDFEDLEIGRAVVYMANAAGGKFPVPSKPAAAPADGASAAAPAASGATPVAAAK
ncbi:c-type cytochrome [Variovorax sp. HJSM1_2]|uniref:c-type cytochrome n=1 Tax=Variovorax sp. HJSM1_2 TaxID=3366263 RepID=UPI003BEBA81F